MLIKAQPNVFKNIESFVNQSVFLDESESVMTAHMVPVVENTRLNANIIKIEDLVNFAESNGITDAGYAIDQICEASGIDPNSIIFSIQEENMVLGEDYAETAIGFLNEDARVVLSPLSQFDKVSLIGDMFLEAAYLTEDFEHFLCEFAVLNEEERKFGDPFKDDKYKGYSFVTKLNSTNKKDENGNPVQGQGYRNNDDESLLIVSNYQKDANGKYTADFQKIAHGDSKYNYSRSDAATQTRKTIDDYQEKLANAKSEEEFNNIKKAAGEALAKASTGADQSFTYNGNYMAKQITDLSKDLDKEEYPKSWIAKKIAWFRSLYAKFMNKNKTVRNPGVWGFIKKICAMILNIIDKLARKLQHAVN